MLNRQIALLFAVGVVIGLAGLLSAVLAPERFRSQSPSWAPDAVLWALLAISGLLLLVSQVLIIRSVWRAGASDQGVVTGTGKVLELFWSLIPAAMIAAALVYSLVVT